MQASDFKEFDRILAMDRSHLEALREMAPETTTAVIELFLPTYAPGCGLSDVPDPYYGGAEGFENVLSLIEDGCRTLLGELTAAKG